MAELGLEQLPRQFVSRLRDHLVGLFAEATQHPGPLRGFPGSMPLTMSRRHLSMICAMDYVVLEKSDGMRYLLFATAGAVYLVDRRMNFYDVKPNPYLVVINQDEEPQMHDNTVLDGELTLNQATGEYDYLVYDCVVIHGDFSVAQWDYRRRLNAATVWVAQPRLYIPAATGTLRIRVKDYYEKVHIRDLFAHIVKDSDGEYVYSNHDRADGVIANHNDGVILAPVRMPYPIKACSALLKWKPPHLNSVDFALQLTRTTDPRTSTPSVTAHIAYKGDRDVVRLREVYFPSAQRREWAADFARYHNSIVECAYDLQAGEWRYIRQREDKETPNFSSTVIDTMESIAESVLRDELVHKLETRSAPLPADAQEMVEGYKATAAAARFRNDYWDADNEGYVDVTVMSRVPVPCMELYGGGERRSGGSGMRDRPRGPERVLDGGPSQGQGPGPGPGPGPEPVEAVIAGGRGRKRAYPEPVESPPASPAPQRERELEQV